MALNEYTRLFDYLQDFNFHAFDLSIPVPGITAFTPTFGFNSISSPSISVDYESIQEGNWEFSRKVIKSAEVDEITFTRGVYILDSDFWRWIVNAITGYNGGKVGKYFKYNIRRDILLVQFTNKNWGSNEVSNFGVAGFNLRTLGLARVPGKGWVLKNCIPVGYRASSDFDANSDEISISELTIAFEYFEEWSIV